MPSVALMSIIIIIVLSIELLSLVAVVLHCLEGAPPAQLLLVLPASVGILSLPLRLSLLMQVLMMNPLTAAFVALCRWLTSMGAMVRSQTLLSLPILLLMT